jgi:LysM repeat protein
VNNLSVYESFLYARQNSCPMGTTVYVIKPGDTFYAIAQRFGVTVAAIAAANPGVDPNRLQVGQQICVPGGGPGPGVCPGGTSYTIRPGDSFYALAARFGVSVSALIAANPGVDPNRLVVGQTICIPGVPVPPPTPVTTPCCTLLQPNYSNLPPNGEIPIGVVFVKQQAMSTRLFTFAAADLPTPGDMGNFNSYVGVLNLFQEGNPADRVTVLVRLISSSFGNQPVTWAGATVTTGRPVPGETAEIRPLNIATGVQGTMLLRNDLGACRS